MKGVQNFMNLTPALRERGGATKKLTAHPFKKFQLLIKQRKKEFIGEKCRPSGLHSTNPIRSHSERPNTDKRSPSQTTNNNNNLNFVPRKFTIKNKYIQCEKNNKEKQNTVT